ncbi:MAG: TldD/PmbA family protein [Bacteroidales bacterium]|nr:TldD/PmbA family protein [Bacteroidales bacterium]
MTEGRLTYEEIQAADKALSFAAANGADKCRITLTKSLMDMTGILNGRVDKVTHCLDRAITFSLFVDGRFGTFSSNRLDEKALEKFILKAIGTVRMLAKDKFRDLPPQERVARPDLSGENLGLCDIEAYESMTPAKRRAFALDSSRYKKWPANPDYKVISEEGEYSDSISDIYIIDTAGTRCRQTETSFEYGVEVTIADSKGNRFSANTWDANPHFALLHKDVSDEALKMAVAKIGSKACKSGRYPMVLSNICSSRLLTPMLTALGGYAIQQKNSFMVDTLGKKILPDYLTIMDRPHMEGCSGARLFDSEGVATEEGPVIEAGVVKKYFVNTYISNKTGMKATVDDISKACVVPTAGKPDEVTANFDGTWIEVNGFNGGNCNSVTGDFSYGVEGFVAKRAAGGRIIRKPVKEMLITGNLLELWNNLEAACDDALRKNTHQVGTLIFRDVDFSG